MPHVVLLGDSIFDNGAYAPGKPDVVQQLRESLSTGWKASLLAVDGDVIGNVASQLSHLPSDASHLVVSAGGNDALGYASILRSPVATVAEALIALAEVRDKFGRDYFIMLQALARTRLPIACCTIYEPRYDDQMERKASATALCILNDCILRLAAFQGAAVIDLRTVCDEAADFANPIEPSDVGGAKIAGAIQRILLRSVSAVTLSESRPAY